MRAAASALLAGLLLAGAVAEVAAQEQPRVGPRLRSRIQAASSGERIRIQVKLRERDLPRQGPRRRSRIRARQERARSALPRNSFKLRRRYRNLSGMAGWARVDAVAALERHPEVERVYLDRRIEVAMNEGVALLGSDLIVAAGFTGQGVNIGLVDTGIDTDHIHLADALVAEECFCDNDPVVGVGCCPNGGETQSGPGAAEDDSGHGTGMAGVMTSARPGRNGIAPNAGIVAVRVLSAAGGGTTSDIDAGLDWILTNHAALDIRVVNMSLSDQGEYDDEEDFPCSGSITSEAIADLVAAGVTVFAASGNNGYDDGLSFPACIPDAISVGGVYDVDLASVTWPCLDPPACSESCFDMPVLADDFVCQTNAGPLLDVLAPNWHTRTLALDDSNATLGGTSISSAYASGEAALLLSVDPTLTPAAIRTLLSDHGNSVTNPEDGNSYNRTDLFAAYGEVLLTLDTDGDGILDDGDASGTIGDATCVGGQTANCDDNCPVDANPSQADDDSNGIGNACDVTLCAADEHVASNACVACAPGTTNAAGDDPSGPDTPCDATLCSVNEHVAINACVSCEAGTTNIAGDDASGPDTPCDATLCSVNEHVALNACVACAPGTTNAAGDDASGTNTSCDATLCSTDEHVASNACVSCAAGTTNAAGDDASGTNTSCDATLCSTDEHVASNACVACGPGTTNAAGDDA
ncbi:MAG: S8 family serine peptidase, partial [Myxococcota bacterium]